MKRFLKIFLWFILGLLALWLILEIAVRTYESAPLKTDFYSSLRREAIPARQQQVGVQSASGTGWIHLGWIADPERESYHIQMQKDSAWTEIGTAEFGSFLWKGEGGTFRVMAAPKDGSQARFIGEATVSPKSDSTQVLTPRIAGLWQSLFKPQKSGNYINDNTVYQDAQGKWRLIGITSKTEGDFNAEKYFATAVSADFPPAGGMTETDPIADFGQLAWAPDVIEANGSYHLFWSPHELHQMDSKDGIAWENHVVTMPAPYHKFFRDAMVMQVAPNQWLLYSTARGAYFSEVDIYQSFDLTEWQYIGAALESSWGSERNSPLGSMESPFVIETQGHYYLSLTYNNDSFFWPGILLTFKVWPNPDSYNDTLIFHSDNPYDFGVYRGRGNSPTLLTQLTTHAPEYIYNPQTKAWYITTAGWPWVSTLTHGEVAVVPLEWVPAK
jgi:hypothetical protein